MNGDVWVDALGAVLVATHVVHDRRDRARAADCRDDVALADAGGHDAGQITGLRLVEDQALVVGEARAGHRILTGLELVHADEVDVGVFGRCRKRGRADGEADRDDHVEVIVDQGLDVRLVVAGVRGDDRPRLRGADGSGAVLRTQPAVFVEVLVVERPDIGDDADLRIARAGRLDRFGRGRGDVANFPTQALADVDGAATSRAGRQGQRHCDQRSDTRVPSLHPHWYSLFPARGTPPIPVRDAHGHPDWGFASGESGASYLPVNPALKVNLAGGRRRPSGCRPYHPRDVDRSSTRPQAGHLRP